VPADWRTPGRLRNGSDGRGDAVALNVFAHARMAFPAPNVRGDLWPRAIASARGSGVRFDGAAASADCRFGLVVVE